MMQASSFQLSGNGGLHAYAFQWKLLLLGLFIVLDLAIATVSDYDFSTGATKVALGMFALTILAQFGVVVVLYLLMSATFPFQVGLVGIISSRFHKQVMVMVLYLIISCFAGGIRVVHIRTVDDVGPNELLGMPFYTVISSFQKLLAPIYYAMTIRAGFELCDPAYYTEDAWEKVAASMLEGRTRLHEMRDKYPTGGYLRHCSRDSSNGHS